MQTKLCYVDDVLALITNQIFFPRNISGARDILHFMAGGVVLKDELPRVSAECRAHLSAQFPQLAGEDAEYAIEQLSEALNCGTGRKENIVMGWLAEVVSGKYGFGCDEVLEVRPLPQEARLPENRAGATIISAQSN